MLNTNARPPLPLCGAADLGGAGPARRRALHTTHDRAAHVRLYPSQRLIQVVDQVPYIFENDGEPNQPVTDPTFLRTSASTDAWVMVGG